MRVRPFSISKPSAADQFVDMQVLQRPFGLRAVEHDRFLRRSVPPRKHQLNVLSRHHFIKTPRRW